jgi:hypothetical protein
MYIKRLGVKGVVEMQHFVIRVTVATILYLYAFRLRTTICTNGGDTLAAYQTIEYARLPKLQELHFSDILLLLLRAIRMSLPRIV